MQVSSGPRKENNEQNNNHKDQKVELQPTQFRRRDRIVYSSKHYKDVVANTVGSKDLHRGVLWHQKDKFFSRWKERYFVLNQGFLICFKNELQNQKLLCFKYMLLDVDSVALVTKRGCQTIVLVHRKQGRIYLRQHSGINDWYNKIENAMSQRKKVNQLENLQISDLDKDNDMWLLSRHSLLDSPRKGGLNTSHCYLPPKVLRNMHNKMNRQSLVTDILLNESQSSTVQNRTIFSDQTDSGFESGHNSGAELGLMSVSRISNKNCDKVPSDSSKFQNIKSNKKPTTKSIFLKKKEPATNV